MSDESPKKVFEEGDIPDRAVDLVIYIDGERIVVGKAEVSPDGTMTASVDPITNPMVTNIIGAIEIGEFSFGLPRKLANRQTLPPLPQRIPFTAGDLPFDGAIPE